MNFVANLGGAMAGVLLAFWIERGRARRGAKTLYAQLLRTSHSELSYLNPMCKHDRDALTAGTASGSLDSFAAPATRVLLTSPLVHDQAPYSLIMALTIACHCFDATESAIREARGLKLTEAAARERLGKLLGSQLDKAISMIAVVLEQIDSELKLLRTEKVPNARTQDVSQRLQEILRG